MNEPGQLVITVINQVGAKEKYREGGKTTERNRERKSMVIFQKKKETMVIFQKKKSLITAFFKAPGAASPAVTCKHISVETGCMFWACVLSLL